MKQITGNELKELMRKGWRWKPFNLYERKTKHTRFLTGHNKGPITLIPPKGVQYE